MPSLFTVTEIPQHIQPFVIGYKLWPVVEEDAAPAWRPVLEYDL